jgi:cytochrome c oxidase subunit 2
MIGRVVVMEPAAYQAWLTGSAPGAVAGGSMESAGQQLFEQLGCATCHQGTTGARGPSLAGLFGNQVKLADGRTVVADEGYIRDSILDPQAAVVQGYQPIMPTFKGLVSEEGLLQLIAYIKSLKPVTQPANAAPPASEAMLAGHEGPG